MFALPTTITRETTLLEELNNLPADAAAQVAYSIMTGKGRSRVTDSAEKKGSSNWRLNLLKAGEIGLADLSTGKSMMSAITSQTAAV